MSCLDFIYWFCIGLLVVGVLWKIVDWWRIVTLYRHFGIDEEKAIVRLQAHTRRCLDERRNMGNQHER
jgi:hypothetical protein